MKGVEDPSQLTEEEAMRFFWISRSGWLGTQGLYRQWELGALPDEEWAVWNRVICDEWALPGVRSHFRQQHAPLLLPRFVELVEGCGTSATG